MPKVALTVVPRRYVKMTLVDDSRIVVLLGHIWFPVINKFSSLETPRVFATKLALRSSNREFLNPF